MKVLNQNVNDKRTTLTLSISVEDKKKLKMYAIEKDMTIASVIHEWISNECDNMYTGQNK